MTEVEKLYSLAGVEKKEYGYCDWDSNCPYPHHRCNNECPYWKIKKVDFPPFTAEKQIELIKWLIQKNFYDERIIRSNYEETYFYCSYLYDYCESEYFEKFEEALANVINYFWQDLTEAEQNEIREILK